MATIKQVEKIGRYITVESAAKRTGFARSHIVYLARVGNIYAVKFGDVLGIDVESLDTYVANRRKPAEDRSERG